MLASRFFRIKNWADLRISFTRRIGNNLKKNFFYISVWKTSFIELNVQLVQYNNHLTHFQPMFQLWINQVVGCYYQNVWKTPVEEWHFKYRCRSSTWEVRHDCMFQPNSSWHQCCFFFLFLNILRNSEIWTKLAKIWGFEEI